MKSSFKEQLNSMKESHVFTPRESWVSKNKKNLLDQIVVEEKPKVSFIDKISEAVHLLTPKGLSLLFRPSMAAMLAVVVVIGGFGAKAASANSLPGEKLYKVKRASESVEVVLTSKDQKASKHIELAKKRVDEVKKIREQQKKVSKKTAQDTIKSIKNNIENAKEHINGVSKPEVVDVALALNETKKQVKSLQQDISEVVNLEEDIQEDDTNTEASSPQNTLDELQEGLEEVDLELQFVQGEVLEDILSLDENELEQTKDKVKELANDALSDISDEINLASSTAKQFSEILEEEQGSDAMEIPSDSTSTPKIEEESEEQGSDAMEIPPDSTSTPKVEEESLDETVKRVEENVVEIKEKLVEADSTTLREVLQGTKEALQEVQGIKEKTAQAEELIEQNKEENDILAEENFEEEKLEEEKTNTNEETNTE